MMGIIEKCIEDCEIILPVKDNDDVIPTNSENNKTESVVIDDLKKDLTVWNLNSTNSTDESIPLPSVHG